MESLAATWSGLDGRRRVTLIVASVAVIAAVIFLSKLVSAPRLTLLYGGLEGPAASEIITVLDQQGVAYDVRGDAIYVDSTARDSLRLTLAGQGLPSGGSPGYELLDGLSGFGTTSQMFDAAYWRAKEGELARTITAAPNIRTARVHISVSTGAVFRQNADPTASVMATTSNGSLDLEQARALRFLVAAAVPGLNPTDVSVIDGQTGVVLGSGSEISAHGNGPKQEEALRRSVERLIEARVGPGNAVVEMSIEYVTERESITERRVDPETRIAISSETEERTNSSTGGLDGAVTVASNLPDGDAAGGGGESTSQNAETREVVNYDVSETQREVIREPGAIRRVTVAALVNGIRSVDETGAEVVLAREEAELAVLGDLVKAAIGFDEARGDKMTIRSLEFETVVFDGSSPIAERFGGLDMTTIILAVILAAVTVVLALFVLRPMIMSQPAIAAPALSPQQAEENAAAGETLPAIADAAPPALDGEIDLGDFGAPQMNAMGDFDLGTMGDGLPSLDAPNDPVDRLKNLISERQDETMEILRSWMEDDREKT